MAHLKRLKVSKTWPLKKRKGLKFIARPMPGAHKLKESITINHILKEMLNYTKTTRESKKVLNDGKILINSKIIKEHKFPVGLFDTISIPETNEYYLLLYDHHGKFNLKKISKESASIKVSKIINKTILKNKKTQINFHNGKNLLVNKDTYRVGDTIIFKDEKIWKHLKFEKGAYIYLTSGINKGKAGILEKIEKKSNLKPEIITIIDGKEHVVTTRDYALVIYKELANE